MPPVVSYPLHNRILSWSPGSIKFLPTRQGLNSSESSHSHRACEAVSAWVLSHTPVAVSLRYRLLALASGFPPGTSRHSLPSLEATSFNRPSSIGWLELLVLCDGMPELLARSIDMLELLVLCDGMPELLARSVELLELLAR
jgi:hypothetical protein